MTIRSNLDRLRDLIADGRQPVFDSGGDRVPDVRFRHPLRHDRDQRLGLVPHRHLLIHNDAGRQTDHKGQNEEPPVPPDDATDFVRRVCFAREHGYRLRIVNHTLRPARAPLRSTLFTSPGVSRGFCEKS